MIRHPRVICALGVMSALLALTACGGSSPAVRADSGFTPGANGFSFQNYGEVLSGGLAPVNLTAHDVQMMFGDGVCFDPRSRTCDLTPEAQAWLAQTNQAMAGGHCYGFAVLSELLWQHKLKVATLGAATTKGLRIQDNQALQRLLAYDWALQLLPSVWLDRVAGTPDQILARLEKVLKPHPSETYTVAFWKPDGTGGHAVTPYAVKGEGDGKFDVLIYDNNWPGQARAISFDTKADSWTYHASINPDAPGSTYVGDAQTKTISLFPTSPGLGTQPCPFCGKVPAHPPSGAGAANTEEIYLRASDSRDASLVIQDSAGRRLGYINGGLVNEIPGAQEDELISNQDWGNKVVPDFFVPADSTYTITIDGAALSAKDTQTLGVIGPSFDLAVKNIPMQPGEKDTLVVEPDATRLEVGVSDHQADYSFEIGGTSDAAGSTVNLTLPAEGGSLTVQSVGPAQTSKLNLRLTRSTKEGGAQVFSHRAISLAGGDTAEFYFGGWTSADDGLLLTTTHDGQRSTGMLNNEAG
jgi:hypothetical protein